jgi:hypothetical protein
MSSFVVKEAHKGINARKIIDLMTKLLEGSGYWR